MMADGYSSLSTTKIDVGDNLPVENAINDQCHAFFLLNYLDYKVYRP